MLPSSDSGVGTDGSHDFGRSDDHAGSDGTAGAASWHGGDGTHGTDGTDGTDGTNGTDRAGGMDGASGSTNIPAVSVEGVSQTEVERQREPTPDCRWVWVTSGVRLDRICDSYDVEFTVEATVRPEAGTCVGSFFVVHVNFADGTL